MVPAFEVALSLFADYDAHRADGFQPELDDHWMWYITNGHLQCADCICYPEIGDPDFYQVKSSERRKWPVAGQSYQYSGVSYIKRHQMNQK